MNVYFDTEFTGLVPDTTLISIGMISETGRYFYAEFTDYNRDLCDDWIKENVLSNLWALPTYIPKNESETINDDFQYVRGNSAYIANELEKWLLITAYGEGRYADIACPRIQLVSDVCHYDMTLLCNLFGGAMNLPANVNPVCYDICQDIALYYSGCTEGTHEMPSVTDLEMKRAFDVDRKVLLPDDPAFDSGWVIKKHNAIYDAYTIKCVYEKLRGRKLELCSI